MSVLWDYAPSSGSSREFLVSAYLFVSNEAASALKKPQSRKRNDKRDSPLAAAGDDSRKIKERSSKGSTGSGKWREVTCKLAEEQGRCLFSLYLDGTMLYQTIFAHLLKQTDVRMVDSSLFFRKACLGIYCPNDKRQTTAETNEPVYIQFDNADICGTWAILLKSYAVPEIYGQRTYIPDGGAFRMWRQLEVTVIQGRNLGDTRPDDSASNFDPPEAELTDIYVSCEVLINEVLCGRTTPKKNLVSPLWQETIKLNDLPPFRESDHLEIRVWEQKKSPKPIFLGAVRVAPRVLPRIVDQGWYPVLQNPRGRLATSTQAGELQLKIRVDQEIILPQSVYANLYDTLNSRNFLDWIADLQKRLKFATISLTAISTHLVSIAAAQNTLIDQIIEYAAREMERTPFSAQDTLFRGNTTLTKVMENCMMWYGKAFLEASVGRVIRKIYDERVVIEPDSDRHNQGSEKTVDPKQREQLVDWCREVWAQIYSVRSECPEEIRKLFGAIRKLVEQRVRMNDTNQNKYPHLHWQSVSAFCFLRFIVPAILNPHLFGICPGIPSLPVKRTLIQIAKAIQSLANLNAGQHKESAVRAGDPQDFFEENRGAMFDYLMAVSSDSPACPKTTGDSRDRQSIINTLRERTKLMPPLEQESIPTIPHFSDVPRHLASIANSVYRHAQSIKFESLDEDSKALNDLCLRCVEVQEEAAERVIQPATDDSYLSTAREDVPRRHSIVIPTSETTARSRIVVAGLAEHESIPNFGGLQRHFIHHKLPSSDSVPSLAKEEKLFEYHQPTDPLADISDDAGRRRGKLLKGILRR